MGFDLADEMRRIVGDPKRVIAEEAHLWAYSYDASLGEYRPDVVVQPKTTGEVAAILKLANREKVPVTPRGRGTSLSGGPLPVRGGIVLDMARMDDKLIIDPEDLVAVVSPGVSTARIHEAAERYGLMYPPDPSSSSVSTIGGNLAENAGGPRGLKYGVTRDYVLGLEVVTPEGEIIRTGGRTVKNVTGYDLTRLIIGSEGTLGIITEAILRLIPKPSAAAALLAVYDELVDAGTAISRTLSSGVLPAKMEIIDRFCIAAVESYEPCGLPRDAEAVLLVEVDGHPSAVEAEAEQVRRICKETGAREVRTAMTPEERDRLWRARRLISPAVARIKPTKISEDATVPRSRIPEMFRRLQAIREKYGIHLVVFGHVGDGNLHPNILCDRRDPEEMRRVERAIAEIFEAAVELGGTLSGEHGIGTMKAPFMEMELGPVTLEMMKRIKRAWDPNNILNPGKIFPESDR